MKNRVVILGGGFIGTSLKKYHIKNKSVILFKKKDIDLSKSNEVKLNKKDKEDDILLLVLH